MSKIVAPDSLIPFVRRRDYLFVRGLGQGACGETVLLHDDVIDRHFVCKKYSPFAETHREELFSGFLREIRLLHEIHHPNVVRVFNYFLYPDSFSGYILMEFVEGQEIDDHIAENPDSASSVFKQVIDGFAYLESINILHRDIRAPNIMVTNDGEVKIIDLGFGKRIQQPDDFDKSISLNWWCELPLEFAQKTYDFSTEVYFVGKLFERLLQDQHLENFNHSSLLARMCQRDPKDRIATFSDVQGLLIKQVEEYVEFSITERLAYKTFADEVTDCLTRVESGSKYNSDFVRLRTRLDEVYRANMLEDVLPDSAVVLRCFLVGTFYYKKTGMTTMALRNFISLLNYAPPAKQRVALANLHSRLDAVERYVKPQPRDEDDIPF